MQAVLIGPTGQITLRPLVSLTDAYKATSMLYTNVGYRHIIWSLVI